MPDVTCPSCGHHLTPDEPSSTASANPSSAGHPDPSVVRWFRSDPSWLGELSTDEVYGGYLRATTGRPVSRARFVADLAHLGVEKVLDDDTPVLVRA
ncbi:hypothetical protein [Microlunatus flavus]|uniref:Uncharacterized protein n=1 Tax=Microlunatus flavus TaxID=1036181 RepID=A0A1H8ZR49_9ACTN|nr:hypothetical protein [Microlunatus flavus]SEP66966.1 hypothetical protein SAMN05421756_101335 [Microlunatus flavus]